jgi:chromosome segregation ATPase
MIFSDVKEIIKRMDNAYKDLRSKSEAEIQELNKKVTESNNLIEGKDAEITEHKNSLNQVSGSLEELKEKCNTLTKQLNDSITKERSLSQEYNSLEEVSNDKIAELKNLSIIRDQKIKELNEENNALKKRKIEHDNCTKNTKVNICKLIEELLVIKQNITQKLNQAIAQINEARVKLKNDTANIHRSEEKDKVEKHKLVKKMKSNIEELRSSIGSLTKVVKDIPVKKTEIIKKILIEIVNKARSLLEKNKLQFIEKMKSNNELIKEKLSKIEESIKNAIDKLRVKIKEKAVTSESMHVEKHKEDNDSPVILSKEDALSEENKSDELIGIVENNQ